VQKASSGNLPDLPPDTREESRPKRRVLFSSIGWRSGDPEIGSCSLPSPRISTEFTGARESMSEAPRDCSRRPTCPGWRIQPPASGKQATTPSDSREPVLLPDPDTLASGAETPVILPIRRLTKLTKSVRGRDAFLARAWHLTVRALPKWPCLGKGISGFAIGERRTHGHFGRAQRVGSALLTDGTRRGGGRPGQDGPRRGLFLLLTPGF
jgi:hypothetical protein